MSRPRPIERKMVSLDELAVLRERMREDGKTVVFTNGCFDLLHSGHLLTLTQAREAGDALIVAINSDASVRRIKGPDRPIMPEGERREILAAMFAVDYVIVFDEPDPGCVIDRLIPDVLVKGGDWAQDAIIGRETVEAHGGRVLRIPPRKGRSSTNIIEKILDQ